MAVLTLRDGDSGQVETLTASNQGLLIVLVDGRVLLVDLPIHAGHEIQAAWTAGVLTEINVTLPYVFLKRAVLH